MICRPCAAGADVKAAFAEPLRRTASPEEGRPWWYALRVANSMHALCKGGSWCDCQHRGSEKTEEANSDGEADG